MNPAIITSILLHITSAVSKGVILALVIPLAVALLLSIPVAPALALIGTTLVIEYGAAPVGIGLGLPPAYVFFLLTCVALGAVLMLFDIFDSAGEHSHRVGRFLDRSRKKAENSKILSKYGIYGLPLVVLTLGFYVCPPVAWVCGWDRKRSILLTMAGYCAISAILIIATGDILHIIFPQN